MPRRYSTFQKMYEKRKNLHFLEVSKILEVSIPTWFFNFPKMNAKINVNLQVFESSNGNFAIFRILSNFHENCSNKLGKYINIDLFGVLGTEVSVA